MAFREVTLTEEERKALGGKFWKPKAIGDKLVGFYVGYKERQHDFGQGKGLETLHSYKILNREGEWTHDANADLHAKLQKATRPAADGGVGLESGKKHVVSMTYSHDVDTPNGKMRGFKLQVNTDFKPAVAAPPAPPPPKPAPVDDDIPF